MMNQTKKLAYTGIMTALVFLATFLVKIPIPFSTGYIHLGDCMVFLAALLLGWKYGAFAAGVGSMLADIMGGYAIWAGPTLIIKSVMALIIGLALRNMKTGSKFVYGSSAVILWTAFIIGMRRILTGGMENQIDELAQIMEKDTTQLTGLANVSSSVLVISAVAVLALVAGIYIYLRKKENKIDLMFIIGLVSAGLWMVTGYYLTEYLLYGNKIVPIFSIPLNLLQFTVGLIIASAVYLPLKKYYNHIFID